MTGRLTVASQGFSVVLPKAWVAVDVDGASNDSAVQQMLANSTGKKVTAAQAKQTIEAMRALMPQSVKLVLLDPTTYDPKTTFVSTAVVARLPTGEITLTQLEASMAANLARTSGATNVRHSQQKLANGKALLVTYELKMAIAGVTDPIRYTTYLEIHGGFSYMTLLVTLGTPSTATTRQIASIAGSMKFLANADTAG